MNIQDLFHPKSKKSNSRNFKRIKDYFKSKNSHNVVYKREDFGDHNIGLPQKKEDFYDEIAVLSRCLQNLKRERKLEPYY